MAPKKIWKIQKQINRKLDKEPGRVVAGRGQMDRRQAAARQGFSKTLRRRQGEAEKTDFNVLHQLKKRPRKHTLAEAAYQKASKASPKSSSLTGKCSQRGRCSRSCSRV
ncbi:uncharacterized protein LOC123202373 [Mangifera indica]|uniref:uncharacterized protein LOC123202373 n=1 Tax=Mangifera indica TaxID=29780 RepID=UPI001CFADBCF|nr:uncharacterized protein LOC123202373 [Mangifera indica]